MEDKYDISSIGFNLFQSLNHSSTIKIESIQVGAIRRLKNADVVRAKSIENELVSVFILEGLDGLIDNDLLFLGFCADSKPDGGSIGGPNCQGIEKLREALEICESTQNTEALNEVNFNISGLISQARDLNLLPTSPLASMEERICIFYEGILIETPPSYSKKYYRDLIKLAFSRSISACRLFEEHRRDAFKTRCRFEERIY